MLAGPHDRVSASNAAAAVSPATNTSGKGTQLVVHRHPAEVVELVRDLPGELAGPHPHGPDHGVRLDPGAVGEDGVSVADLRHRRPEAAFDAQLVQRRLDLLARTRAELVSDHVRPVHQQHPAPVGQCGRGLQADEPGADDHGGVVLPVAQVVGEPPGSVQGVDVEEPLGPRQALRLHQLAARRQHQPVVADLPLPSATTTRRLGVDRAHRGPQVLDADRFEDPAELDLGQVRLRFVQPRPQHQVLVRRDERDAQVRVAAGQRRSRRAPHARETTADDHNVRHRFVLSHSPPGSGGSAGRQGAGLRCDRCVRACRD